MHVIEMRNEELGFDGLNEFHEVSSVIKVRMHRDDVAISVSVSGDPSDTWTKMFMERTNQMVETWNAKWDDTGLISFPRAFADLADKFAKTLEGRFDRSWDANEIFARITMLEEI